MKNTIDFKWEYIIFGIWIMLSPLLGSCQKEELSDEIRTLEDARKAIIGEWEWKETIIRHRGQEPPVYETPATENKTIQRTFAKNFSSSLVETIDKVTTRTDYEYSITIDAMAGNGYNSTYFLTSTNTSTKETHLSLFRFENKDTLVFFLRSPSVTFYYSRK